MDHANQRPGPDWLQEVDHTADAGIVVSAGTVAELFERTAWATFNLILEMEAVRPVSSEEIRVEGSDLEDLMVRWLSELNYLHVTRNWLFCAFGIITINERSLHAVVHGEPIDPERHTVFTEIKAITYHALSVVQTGQGYQAKVIFDL
jgi:SHS2 domain-containing protein